MKQTPPISYDRKIIRKRKKKEKYDVVKLIIYFNERRGFDVAHDFTAAAAAA